MTGIRSGSAKGRTASPSRHTAKRPARHQSTGVVTEQELRKYGVLPSLARLKQGPVAIVECIENIPCNPCTDACPRKAITIKGGLTDLPIVDFEKCNGCTLCVARCPGLAIFVVDYTHSRAQAAVTFPYEMLPRPKKGDKVVALDRRGTNVCSGTVTRVADARAFDRCAVVTVAVPKKYWNRVRGMAVPRRG